MLRDLPVLQGNVKSMRASSFYADLMGCIKRSGWFYGQEGELKFFISFGGNWFLEAQWKQ